VPMIVIVTMVALTAAFPWPHQHQLIAARNALRTLRKIPQGRALPDLQRVLRPISTTCSEPLKRF
jgi:hypothetical protein